MYAFQEETFIKVPYPEGLRSNCLEGLLKGKGLPSPNKGSTLRFASGLGSIAFVIPHLMRDHSGMFQKKDPASSAG